MSVQTRQVTVNIFDNDGDPLENARVEIRLVGLGNEPGGAVSPGIQTQFTDAAGTTVFELWENRFDYSDTYYVVSSWNPVTGAQIHRREAFAVPDYDADLQELLGMALAGIDPTVELLNQINAIRDQSVAASEEAKTSAGESADSATAAAASVIASAENASAAELSASQSSGFALAASESSSSAQYYSLAAEQSAQEAADAMDSKINLSEKGTANGVATLGADSIVPDSQLPDFIKSDQRGVANGVAPLGPNNLIQPEYLPSYVDDVLEFTTYADLPVPGETGKIYVILTAGEDEDGLFPKNQQFRWSGTIYQRIVASPGTTDNVVEGINNLYHTQERVRSSLLTGFAASAERLAIAATDSLMGALEKAQKWLGDLGTAAFSNVGAELEELPTNARLNTRLGTTGNLGSSAWYSAVEHNYDLTPGAVIRNGWLGLGEAGVSLLMDDSNLNGFYRSGGSSPFGSYPHFIQVGESSSHTMQIGGPALNDNILQFRKKTGGVWREVRTLRHTGNTSVDSNGFLKNASPITKLFHDHVENNDEAQDVVLQKESVGIYQLLTERKFATEGWYIETPKDANGNIKVFVTYEENDDGFLIKTFAPDYSSGPVTAGEPVDIPEGRWIDIRMTYTDAEIAARIAAEEAMAAEMAARAEAEMLSTDE